MDKPLTQTELGRRLGISGAMVCKLAKRGMPLDEAAAREWRRQHLSPFHCKGRRIDGNTGLPRGQQPAPKPMTPAELIELAEGIAEVMMDDEGRPEVFADGLPHLRSVLCHHLSDADAERVRLPIRCWDALTR